MSSHNHTTTNGGGRTLLKWVFLGIALMLTIVYGKYRYNIAAGEYYAKRAAAEAYAAAHPPAPHQQEELSAWTFRTLQIPKGGLAVFLHQGAKVFPSGPITITNPDGQTIEDRPGVKTDVGSKTGIYILRANPEGSERSVEICNRW